MKGRLENMVEQAVELYISVVEVALPFALVFGLGNVLLTTFLRAAFGGKLWLGK